MSKRTSLKKAVGEAIKRILSHHSKSYLTKAQVRETIIGAVFEALKEDGI